MAFYHHFFTDEPRNATPETNFLSGWKDIANYLGKGIRTVQRYERELQLPVHRPAGRPRAAVIASRIEIDQWVSASPTILPERGLAAPQQIHDLKTATSTLRHLCTEAHELREGVRAQRKALNTTIERIVLTLSEPDFCRSAERHAGIARQQKERAREMIETAREMSEAATEMRKPEPRPLIVNC